MNMKMINLNLNLLFTFLIFLAIMFMSIGYSALNRNLSISGNLTVLAYPDIEITNISLKEVTNGGIEKFSPSFTSDNTNLVVTLPNIDSTVTYLIEVTNETIDYYHLDKVVEIINNNSNIKYEIKDKEIIYFHPNSVTEIEITFSYDVFSTTNQSIDLNLNYNFDKITYKNLEYITYSGFQYINTGLFNTGDYIFELEFNQTAYNTNHTDSSIGGWIISGRKIGTHSLGVFIGNYGVYNSYGAGTAARQPNIAVNSGWHSLYFSRFIHTIDDNNYVVNGKILIPEEHETEIRIGGGTGGYYASSVSDTRHFIGHMKSVKITDADLGIVLRYYVPAEIIEGPNAGEIGYWDIITDEFYSNAGTGAFLAP